MAKAIKIIERKRRQQQHIDVRRYWTVCVRTYGFLHELHFSSSIFFMLLCGGWINTSKWYRKFSTSKAFHTTHPQSSELWQRNPRLFHAYFSSIPSPLHRLLCTVANIADKYNEQNNRKIFSTTYVWRDFFLFFFDSAFTSCHSACSLASSLGYRIGSDNDMHYLVCWRLTRTTLTIRISFQPYVFMFIAFWFRRKQQSKSLQHIDVTLKRALRVCAQRKRTCLYANRMIIFAVRSILTESNQNNLLCHTYKLWIQRSRMQYRKDTHREGDYRSGFCFYCLLLLFVFRCLFTVLALPPPIGTYIKLQNNNTFQAARQQ